MDGTCRSLWVRVRLFSESCPYSGVDRRWDGRSGSPADGEFRGRRTPVRSSSNMLSTASDDESYSDGGEVLPLSTAAAQSQSHHYAAQEGGSGSRTPGGGEWSFAALDERYLLPLFTNSVASRSFNARKAGRRAAMGLPPEGEVSRDHSEDEEGNLEDPARRAIRDLTGSMSNFLGHLRGQQTGNIMGSNPASPR